MISIVTTFYNRQELFDRTLATIKKSAVKDWELIVVDDASDVPCVCPEAKIIRIEKQDKWWHNPCIPFNMGIKEAKGDIIVIQNPECMHYDDVLSYIQDNIHDGVYLAMGCYALSEEETMALRKGINPSIHDKRFGLDTRNGWYNHPVFRPVGYHFCGALTRGDMDKVGGFDEEYANGISYDDDDFVYRVNDKGIQIKVVRHPFVIHQWHYPFTYKKVGWQDLHTINKNLFKRKWL